MPENFKLIAATGAVPGHGNLGDDIRKVSFWAIIVISIEHNCLYQVSNKMTVAGDKTQLLVLSQWARDTDCVITVAGQVVWSGSQLKLLGVTLDHNWLPTLYPSARSDGGSGTGAGRRAT